MRIPLSALIGLVLTSGFLFVAVFAQWLAPYAINSTVGGVWDAPSSTHWLGTDTIGRDILSRLIYGAQITIFVALAASVLSFSLGSFLGFLAAVRGGDELTQALRDSNTRMAQAIALGKGLSHRDKRQRVTLLVTNAL